MARILVVEDEAPLREAVGAYLVRAGFTVDLAADGEEGWRLFRTGKPDLVVLDRKLPGLSGEDLCRRIKGLSSVPVLMATSLVQEEAVLEAFALGADDYLRKPYSVRELTARVQARLRTAVTDRNDRIEVPGQGLQIDLNARTVCVGTASVGLTPHEFDLLAHFAAHPDQVFSREQLLSQVWPDRADIADRTVDTHIKNLRAKLKAAGAPLALTAVYGRGYRWSP